MFTKQYVVSLRIVNGAVSLPVGEAAEPLDDVGIRKADAAAALMRLHYQAFDDPADCHRYMQPVIDAVQRLGTVGSVLANRIYRDRLDCPDPA